MAKYRLYFQNADLYRAMEEYLYTDARHFFYRQDVSHEKFIDNLNRIRTHFLHDSCEISQDRGDHVWRIRPGRQNAAPVWRLDEPDFDKLREILDEKPETLFVEYYKGAKNGGPAFLNIFNRSATLKTFLEIKLEYPETEFIAFGDFQFNFYFRLGMDGGCVRSRSHTPHVTHDYFQIAPDGQRIQFSPLKYALTIASKYRAAQIALIPDQRRKVSHQHLRSIMMLQATPDYQEQVRGIELNQEYDAVKYLPEEFFPEDAMRPTQLLPREIPILSQALPGDRVLCDSCSLKYRCPVFKPESVCIMPESDGKALADFFDSRNSGDVLDGLRAVLRKQAERVEGAVTVEEEQQKKLRDKGEDIVYSDQVTRMLDNLQRNGEKFLKLVDPRFTKPVVQINNNAPLPTGPQPREIDPAAAREELVELGMPRDAITADHIARYLEGSWNGPNEMQALERGNTIDGELGF